MKQINLIVDPIVDVVTQKGVIPSDTTSEHSTSATIKEYSPETKRTAKYLKSYSVIILVIAVLVLFLWGYVYHGINQMNDSVIGIENWDFWHNWKARKL